MNEIQSLLRQAVRVPDEVVYRDFPENTVVLHLGTGRYYGLDPIAGRMLDAAVEHETLGDAAAALAAEFDQPVDRLEADLCEFCEELLKLELIVLEDPAAG